MKFLTSNSFDIAFDKTAKSLKISIKERDKMLKQNFSKGFQSVNKELNILINSLIEKSIKPKTFDKFRVHEKVKFLIIQRLKTTNDIFDLKKLVKINIRSPKNFLKVLFNISDEIWYLTGDKSLDFNFYSKRFILMNIYLNSFIYFISQKNVNLQNVEKFVDRQIRAVLIFGKLKRKLKDLVIQK